MMRACPQTAVWRAGVFVAAFLAFANAPPAAELYAQAIGQPPPEERAPPPATTPPQPAEPDTTVQAETPDQDLRTKILIGAGIAAVLAAIGGGGGGGSDGAPASTSQTSP